MRINRNIADNDTKTIGIGANIELLITTQRHQYLAC